MEPRFDLDRAVRTLRFPEPLEAEFMADWRRKSVRHMRTVLWVALGVVVFAGLHAVAQPEERPLDWPIRFGAITPALLLLLALTYSPRCLACMQAIGGAGLVFVGVSLIALALRMPETLGANGHVDLILMIIATYTLSRLRLLCAVFVCWSLVVTYNAAASLWTDMPFETLMTHDFHITVANLMGMVSCYATERYLRREFWLARSLRLEQEKSENLLLNILPAPIAERLKSSREAVADSFAEVTVLFADIVGFTEYASGMEAEDLVRTLNVVFTEFDAIAEQHGVEKIKTSGDAYMAAAGVPVPGPGHAEAIAGLGLDIQAALARLNTRMERPIHMRVGINTGPVVAGVIGTKRYIYDLWGDTVNLASRMEETGRVDTVQVSERTADLLRDHFVIEARGEVDVKGRGRMPAYLLVGRRTPPPEVTC